MKNLEKLLNKPKSQAILAIITGIIIIGLSIDDKGIVNEQYFFLTAIGLVAIVGGVVMLLILMRNK